MISQLIVKSNIFDKINDYVIIDVMQKRMSVCDWQQGGCHITGLYTVTHASYRGLSSKSALDIWSLCVCLSLEVWTVDVAATCKALQIARKAVWIRNSGMAVTVVLHSCSRSRATLVKWLGQHYAISRKQRPACRIYHELTYEPSVSATGYSSEKAKKALKSRAQDCIIPPGTLPQTICPRCHIYILVTN